MRPRQARHDASFDDGGFVVVGIEIRPPFPLGSLCRAKGFKDSGLLDKSSFDFDSHPKSFGTVLAAVFHVAPFLSLVCQSSTFSYSMNVQISDNPLL